jgi:hypothetical protein
MSDLARSKIWDDPASTAENRRPAKFRIAATVVTQIDFVASNEETLDGGEPLIPSSRLRLSTRFPCVSSPISDWAAIPLGFGNAL